MAILLQGDIETNVGATKDIYCKVNTITVDKNAGTIQFSVTYWQDKDIAKDFGDLSKDPNYYQHTKNIVSADEILVYKGNKPKTFTLPTLIRFKVVKVVKHMVPTYKKIEGTKQVPYVSFDENGDEITLYRTIWDVQKVKDGEKEVKTEVIKKELIENPWGESYNHLKKLLTKEIEKTGVNLTLKKD